jgi:uncharacterized damage-inducible protein DinB
MTKTILKASVLIAGISLHFASHSQTSILTSHQTLALTDIKAQMVGDWERAKAYTIDYLNTMPADKYTYKPNDSVRTFAGHMLHLAMANVIFVGIALDVAPLPWAQMPRQNAPTAQNKDSVMYYVAASYDFVINAIKNSDVSTWGETKKALGHEATRYALVNKLFEHQTHHRGQTTIYIRMQNIAPPNERLF